MRDVRAVATMNRDEIIAAYDEWVPTRRVRNRIVVPVIALYVQYWSGLWWLSLLVLVVVGAMAEIVWRPGGSSYQRELDRWLENPARAKKRTRRST